MQINDLTPETEQVDDTIHDRIRTKVRQDEEARKVLEAIRRKDKKVKTES